MSDAPKHARDMTPAEYAKARAGVVTERKLTPAVAGDVRTLDPAEYADARRALTGALPARS